MLRLLARANHRKKLMQWLQLTLFFNIFSFIFCDLNVERYQRALDSSVESDQDADIFVAEILPEGLQDLEQMFRPLARYKKAVLDAQIEPLTSQSKEEEKTSEFEIPSLQSKRFLQYQYDLGPDFKSNREGSSQDENMQKYNGALRTDIAMYNGNKHVLGQDIYSEESLRSHIPYTTKVIPIFARSYSNENYANNGSKKYATVTRDEKESNDHETETDQLSAEASGSGNYNKVGSGESGEEPKIDSAPMTIDGTKTIYLKNVHLKPSGSSMTFAALSTANNKESTWDFRNDTPAFSTLRDQFDSSQHNSLNGDRIANYDAKPTTQQENIDNNSLTENVQDLYNPKWKSVNKKISYTPVGNFTVVQGNESQYIDEEQSWSNGENYNVASKQMGPSEPTGNNEQSIVNEQPINKGTGSGRKMQANRYINYDVRDGSAYNGGKDITETQTAIVDASSKDGAQIANVNYKESAINNGVTTARGSFVANNETMKNNSSDLEVQRNNYNGFTVNSSTAGVTTAEKSFEGSSADLDNENGSSLKVIHQKPIEEDFINVSYQTKSQETELDKFSNVSDYQQQHYGEQQNNAQQQMVNESSNNYVESNISVSYFSQTGASGETDRYGTDPMTVSYNVSKMNTDYPSSPQDRNENVKTLLTLNDSRGLSDENLQENEFINHEANFAMNENFSTRNNKTGKIMTRNQTNTAVGNITYRVFGQGKLESKDAQAQFDNSNIVLNETKQMKQEKTADPESISDKNETKLSKEEAARKIFISSVESSKRVSFLDVENKGQENMIDSKVGTANQKVTSSAMSVNQDEGNRMKTAKHTFSRKLKNGEETYQQFQNAIKGNNYSEKEDYIAQTTENVFHGKVSKDPKKGDGKGMQIEGRKSIKSQENSEKGKASRVSHKKIHSTTQKKNAKHNKDFIAMLMSAKARELYKNLIKDTSKALTLKTHNQEQRRRHRTFHVNPNQLFRKMTKSKKQASSMSNDAVLPVHQADMYQTEYVNDALSVKTDSGLRDLASNLLSTMVKNDQRLVNQALSSPTRPQKMISRKGGVPEKLDNRDSLIEKLAELKYVSDEKQPKEIPLPQKENAADTSLNGIEVETENPGKTVLQKQGRNGLGADVNLDNLDGSKEGYQFKMLDGKIEGELEVNEKNEENNIGAKIGTLSSKLGKESYGNISAALIKVKPSTTLLTLYNAEETLENEDADYQNEVNYQRVQANMEKKPKPNQSMLRQKSKVSFLGHMQEPHANVMPGKKVFNQTSLYFAGNSSLWKNHPVVSMDIDPLVDVFYKVNHQNLIDLVENSSKDGGKGKMVRRKWKENMLSKIKNKKKARIRGQYQKPKTEAESKWKSREFVKERRKRRKRKKKIRHRKRLKQEGKYRKGHTKKLFFDILPKRVTHLNRSKATSLKSQHRRKSHLKKKNVSARHKYKLKHKKHVKGTAKFGISGAERSSNPPEQPEVKNNMPKNVKYYKIENAAKLGAVCIDGSIPGYYLRRGYGTGEKKWIIHLHGGAWCYDAETCFRRSKSILGSTKHWSVENITNFFQGILSDKTDINPWFANWNVVVQTYCDGGLFSGRRVKPLIHNGQKLYFRGRQILKAMVGSLKQRGVDGASDIILSGTSAGGLAVLLQGDYLKHKLPKSAAVRGLVDAGFFLDSQANDGSNIIENQFRGLFETHDPRLRKKCESERINGTKFRCLFPENVVEHAKLPLYFVNSLYDHWQLSQLQQLRCIYNNDLCSQEQRGHILSFRTMMLENLAKTLQRRKDIGLFADSCIGHGQAIVDYTWSRIKVNNQTLRDSFNDWLSDRKGEKRHFNVDCHFPCNGSCPKPMVNLCIKNFKGAAATHRERRNIELC